MGDFKHKIVLIGGTAADLHDYQITPTSQNDVMSGVEIQANAIQTILERKFLIEERRAETVLTIFLLAVLVSIILVFLPLILMVVLVILLTLDFVRYLIYYFYN